MIIFLSDGRLGNQIFQYAFLQTICKPKEKIICLNARQLFDAFDIKDQNFTPVFNPQIIRVFRKLVLPVIKILVKYHFVTMISQEKSQAGSIAHLRYTEITGLFKNVRFVETDFFQSEVFFDPAKLHLVLKEKYVSVAKDFIRNVPSAFSPVFVHVRRGDYLTETYRGIQGLNLPDKYFYEAMKIIEEDINNPFYIFLSDDPDYVEMAFVSISNKLVSHNSPNVDLAIMSLCEGAIMSNSSFAWWGAYLMKTRKSVIAPRFWFGWKERIDSHPGIQPGFSKIIDVG